MINSDIEIKIAKLQEKLDEFYNGKEYVINFPVTINVYWRKDRPRHFYDDNLNFIGLPYIDERIPGVISEFKKEIDNFNLEVDQLASEMGMSSDEFWFQYLQDVREF